MVQHTAILQWPTNRKSYMVCRTAPFSNTLNDPYPGFKVTPFFDAEYLIQEAQLSQRDRATLSVIEYFAKSLKVTQCHSK